MQQKKKVDDELYEAETNQFGPGMEVSNKLIPPNKMGITDEDIDEGIQMGLAFSGGGLKTEKVGRAALKYNDEVFTGVNHGDAFGHLEKKFKDFDFKQVKDGFITTNGRFVSREEATAIAEQAKQIGKGEGTNSGLGLISEDLLR
jgi:hypothetical protein